jgi:hypothetical protein
MSWCGLEREHAYQGWLELARTTAYVTPRASNANPYAEYKPSIQYSTF